MADDDDKFDYDVAFSFHSLDEALATQLNDLLQDRFKTFIWYERQDILAGTDGEATFSSVYGERARFVVVFYRKEWGETPYTRIEQTAIKGRAYDEGYDFTLFIPTNPPPSKPQWLPVTQLYYSLDKFGLDGAAAVIESKIRQFGGEPVVEGISERAARFQRQQALDKARQQFRNSDGGVQAANAAFAEMIATMGENIGKLATPPTNLQFRLESIHTERNFYLLRATKGCATIMWQCHYSNTLDGSELAIEFYDGVPKLPHRMTVSSREATRLKSLSLDYELMREGHSCFVERDGPKHELSPMALADLILRTSMDLAEKIKRDY